MTGREAPEPGRYDLSTEQRHALWENEIAMVIVLALPVVVAAFWYFAMGPGAGSSTTNNTNNTNTTVEQPSVPAPS